MSHSMVDLSTLARSQIIVVLVFRAFTFIPAPAILLCQKEMSFKKKEVVRFCKTAVLQKVSHLTYDCNHCQLIKGPEHCARALFAEGHVAH